MCKVITTFILTGVLAVAAVLPTPCNAVSETSEPAKLPIELAEEKLLEAKGNLLQNEDWQVEDIQEYLYRALFFVYHAKFNANSSFDSAVVSATNNDLPALVDMGYLPFWPEDPLNDWKPLPTSTVFSEEFVPRALIVSVCPPPYYTTFDQPCAASFNLFINAPLMELASPGESYSILNENKEWAVIPEGALYGVSMYSQSDRQRKEIIEKYSKES